MNSPNINQLREVLANLRPTAVPIFDSYCKAASEVILIGSAALGKLGTHSDIDVLFVGNGARYRKCGVDFIWITADKLNSDLWLGSEMAAHVAAYGRWVKGVGAWRSRVSISANAIRSKSERILIRLVKIYNLRASLGAHQVGILLLKSILDIQRLVLLEKGVAPPPSPILLKLIVDGGPALLEAACSDSLLGRLGRTLLFDIFNFSTVFYEASKSLEARISSQLTLWSLNEDSGVDS